MLRDVHHSSQGAPSQSPLIPPLPTVMLYRNLLQFFHGGKTPLIEGTFTPDTKVTHCSQCPAAFVADDAITPDPENPGRHKHASPCGPKAFGAGKFSTGRA